MIIKFGYLKDMNYYIEKSFIVNESTKYKKQPLNIKIIKQEELIRNDLKKYSEEKIINNYSAIIDSDVYNLLITDESFLLLKAKEMSNKELLEENKINIIKYFIKIMDNNLVINQFYYDLYSIFKDENLELEKRDRKSTRLDSSH